MLASASWGSGFDELLLAREIVRDFGREWSFADLLMNFIMQKKRRVDELAVRQGACLLLFMPSGAAHALRQSKAVSFGSPISSPYPTALSPPEHLLKTVHMMTIADADVLNPDLTVAQRPGI